MFNKEDKDKINREDFSVQKIQLSEGEIYHAYAHFAPFHFGDVQKGRHKFYQATSKDKEEAIDLLIKAIIYHLNLELERNKQ